MSYINQIFNIIYSIPEHCQFKLILDGFKEDYEDCDAILSTIDIENLKEASFEHTTTTTLEEDLVIIEFFDKVKELFLKEKLIYEYGNKDSYIEVVKDNGKISYSEYNMISELNDHKITFNDTEFPVNNKGLYII